MSNENQKNANVIDNTELIEAIAEMKKEYSDQKKDRVINICLRSNFFVPAIMSNKTELVADENNNVKFQDNPQAKLLLVQSEQHGQFFPVFTDPEKMKFINFDPQYKPVVISFADIAALTEQTPVVNGFILNPLSENIPYTKDMLALIKSAIKAHNEKEKELENKGIKVTTNLNPTINVE